jgi:predicted RNase H-like HicB family nuclease
MKYAYQVTIEKTGTAFSAFAPDLPGCVATGKDLKEAAQKMKEAMEFHIEGLRRASLPIPKPGSSKGDSKDN